MTGLTPFLEFKKEGIVVGKVEVMANCRKKPRQIVELSGQPSQGLILSLWLPLLLSAIYATPFRACVSLHKCQTRVVPVGGSRWGTHAGWLRVKLLENFPLMAITRQRWTRVNPLMLIHGGLGSTCWRFSLRLIHGRRKGEAAYWQIWQSIYNWLPRQRNEYEWK